MRAPSTETMAASFVAAFEQWTEEAPEKAVPDFYTWCVSGGLLGVRPGQFKPAPGGPGAAIDPEFADGACVTFADGSVAVRDLHEQRRGQPARWHVLPSLTDDILRQWQGGRS